MSLNNNCMEDKMKDILLEQHIFALKKEVSDLRHQRSRLTGNDTRRIAIINNIIKEKLSFIDLMEYYTLEKTEKLSGGAKKYIVNNQRQEKHPMVYIEERKRKIVSDFLERRQVQSFMQEKNLKNLDISFLSKIYYFSKVVDPTIEIKTTKDLLEYSLTLPKKYIINTCEQHTSNIDSLKYVNNQTKK